MSQPLHAYSAYATVVSAVPDNLLSHPEAVEQVLSRRPCGLLTDIDGTISAISPRPVDAVVSARCRRRLRALVRLLDLVAVVSGRPVLDARRMVGLPGVLYVGDHGLERMKGEVPAADPRAGPYQQEVRAAATQLFQHLSGLPGLEGLFLEDKNASFSFHYRGCPDPARARALILEAMAASDVAGRLQVLEARRAVELRPPVDASKGTVLRDLAHEFDLKGLFYLGDDYTDISAFRALRVWREEAPEQGPPARADAGVNEHLEEIGERTAYRGNEKASDRRSFPAAPGRWGLAIAVVSEGSPPEAQLEADYVLDGLPQIEEFLYSLVALSGSP